jgi:hypothetical protein
MYVGLGTVQVSTVVHIDRESHVGYEFFGDEVQVSLGTDADALLILSGRSLEKFAETLNNAVAEQKRKAGEN